ncbi:MAG: gamma carbonic anhydrase family protein [Bacteroidales bacterium]|nr:gamma carbonic anhydrase family protein [Candidatus Sodaliphilus aphodohippi]
MAIIKEVRGFTPKMGENCFLADNAAVIGDVTMGDGCSIWYGAVLRGDVNTITIGNRVNIQDNAVVHTLYQKSVTEIGDDVSVGHNAVIHGAKIGNMVLIGMGSIILDHAEIADGAIIAAGSVVKGGTKIGPNELWAGSPATFKKMVNPEQAKEINVKIAKNYLMYSTWYKED